MSATRGSGITSSITPSSTRSLAVRRRDCAASGARLASRQRIWAHISGEITEYHAFSSISTRLPTPMASAPPLPPSPVTTQTIGTSKKDMRRIDSAMTTPCPRSSASIPGYAPTTSMRVMIGPAKLFGLLHQADSFSIPLGMGQAEIAADVLLGIPSLLRADHRDRSPVEEGDAADDRRIVPERPVAVQLDEIVKEEIDIVEGRRTLGSGAPSAPFAKV